MTKRLLRLHAGGATPGLPHARAGERAKCDIYTRFRPAFP